MSPEQLTGSAAERWVYAMLKQMGHNPRMTTSFTTKNHDIFVNRLPVEVKVANATTRSYIDKRTDKLRQYTRWQWFVHDTAAAMAGEWGLVLIAIYQDEYYPFVLPGSAINNRNHLQLTSAPTIYSGWLAPYLNRWEIIPYLSQGVYQAGGPLFWQWWQREHGGRVAA